MEEIDAIIERVEKLIELDASVELREFINDMNISDVAELINELPKHKLSFFQQLDFQRALAVFRILDLSVQEDLLRLLPSNVLVQLLNDLPPDDRTALLSELHSNVVKEIIKQLNPDERKITLSLLGYPEESVGRLMTPDYIDVELHWTVEQVLTYIRDYGKSSETIDVIYVTDENGKLIDDVRIRDFLLVDPKTTKVEDLVDGRYISLNVNDDQKETMNVFQMNNRVALPVVDDKNVLLGIITIDDVLWVAEEEFTEDIQMIGGMEALDEPYLDVSLFQLYKKRIIWLIILFFGELLTITAMTKFQNEIAKVVILATFIPLIISSGGNSGSQAASLIIQAMALDEISIKDWWRIMRREIFSGLMLGATLCIISFSVITCWHFLSPVFGDHYLLIAFVVGFSLIGVVLWGTLMGSMLPLLLKRLGADPAASSTPFVATLVDVTGLIIYFSFATLFLKGVLL
ncbi:MAG: magnesium transporter [Bacteroidetes bacterium]|nr:magnesium transporter [Bacteroidota bacterium]MBK8145895.1 magnesium transporter [Bacteroidota bacterium]MBP6314893.1 magnesium transporter [Chitinophagaceae bacterium]